MNAAGALAKVLLLAVSLTLAPVMAAEPVLSSALDYSIHAARFHPVTCKAGDLERERGRTLDEVFGPQWPSQPEPVTADGHVRAELLRMPRPNPADARSLPTQRGLVVAAVLVDGAGHPLRAAVLCATMDGFDAYVVRALKRAEYPPARINGAPVTSVAIVVQRFNGVES